MHGARMFDVLDVNEPLYSNAIMSFMYATETVSSLI